MTLINSLSDDALERIARYLSTEEKWLLLSTGDLIFMHRLKRQIYDHKLTLNDAHREDWQHLRSLKLNFKHLVLNLPALYPALNTPIFLDTSNISWMDNHLIFHNLVTLQVHIIGVCWMQELGGAKLAQQFPSVTVIKFFSLIEDDPYDRKYIDFRFLADLVTLKELIFDTHCTIGANMLSYLPSSLEKLHVPMLSFAPPSHEENRLIFPSTCTLNDLFVKRLDLCGPLPSSLKRLQILHSINGNLSTSLLPEGLTSLIVKDGYINASTVLAPSFPQSLTQLSVHLSGHDVIPTEYYKRKRPRQTTKLTFTYSQSYLLQHVDERLMMPPMITRLFMDCSSDQQFEFSYTVHLMVNLVELFVIQRTIDTVDLLGSHVTKQLFHEVPQFDLPPSLRHLTLTIQHAHFAEIQYGGAMQWSTNTIGTHFIHRSVGDRHCALARCTTLESLEINFAAGYLKERSVVGAMQEVLNLRYDADMLDVVIDKIPLGLKALSMNFDGNENLFDGDSFSKLMTKIAGAKTLSLRRVCPPLSSVEWSRQLSLLPRSLRHLSIQLVRVAAVVVPNLPIEVLPCRLRTCLYSGSFAGTHSSNLVAKIFESLAAYKKRTGRNRLPFLRSVGHRFMQYIPNDPDYEFLKTSKLEHQFAEYLT